MANRKRRAPTHALKSCRQVQKQADAVEKLSALRVDKQYSGILKEAIAQRQFSFMLQCAKQHVEDKQVDMGQLGSFVDALKFLGNMKDRSRVWTKRDSEEIQRAITSCLKAFRKREPTSTPGRSFLSLSTAIYSHAKEADEAMNRTLSELIEAAVKQSSPEEKHMNQFLDVLTDLHERVSASNFVILCHPHLDEPIVSNEVKGLLKTYKDIVTTCTRVATVAQHFVLIALNFSGELQDKLIQSYAAVDELMSTLTLGERAQTSYDLFRAHFSLRKLAEPRLVEHQKNLEEILVRSGCSVCECFD